MDKMITTVDNPWNPFNNFNEWLQYDMKQGYYTNEALASLCIPSDDGLADHEIDENITDAMEKMIKDGAISKDGERVDYIIVTRT